NLTRSVEDYLKTIYHLSERGEVASTSSIADSLAVQPASVSGMIKKLAESGLAEHEPYRGVRLTDAGKREALRVLRRHRVLEAYLKARLGYTWDDVHGEAERLEHAVSDDLIDRMESALEHPQHDPHGAPIPTRGGEIEAVDYVTLAEITAGTDVEVRAVQDDDPQRLRYLATLGLLPGVQVRVVERAPFNGPVTLLVGGDNGIPQVVGQELATKIFVRGVRKPS
ncbi:MAG: metal-dependent transcriptional regulator, partial [Gemmatimonadetes bacterium]|nr:metal-dependent transcriptional regulator [Gemmatimonadota bacterium]